MVYWKASLLFLRKHRGSLRPLVLFLILATVPLGIWAFIDSREDSGLADLSDQYASNISIQIQAAVDIRVGALRVLTERIADDPAYGEKGFEISARRRLREFPGLVALTWVDREYILRWGYPKTPNITVLVGKDVRKFPSAAHTQRASITGTPAATPPVSLLVGGRGFVGAFPAMRDGHWVGSLGAIFAIDELMRVSLGGDPSRNFALVITDGVEPVYTHDKVDFGAPFIARRDIQVLDRHWMVTVCPSASYIAQHKTPTKTLLLILGLVLSAAVGLMYLAALDGRRRAEENQARFRDIAESATDWLWELDAELRYTYVSPRVSAVYGVGPEKMLGQGRGELPWPEDNAPEVLQAYRDLMAARKPFRNFEFRSRDTAGATVVARLSGVPLFNKAGQFTGYRGTGTNITAQVEAKRATEQAEGRLFTAMESLPGGFLLYDADGRLVMWNEQLRTFYPKAFPLLRRGMSYEEVVKIVAPLHLAIPESDRVAKLERWFEEFRTVPQEEEIPLNDGRIMRAVDWRASDGSTVCLRFDITEARQREEQLRHAKSLLYDAIEAVPAAFLLWDREERLTLWNSTVENMNPTLQGRLRAGLHIEEYVDIVSVDWVEANTEAGRAARIQRRLADFRGAPTTSEVRLKNGRVGQVIDWRSANNATVSMSFDITEVRRQEEELRHAQKMEAVGQLSGGIAHDFNNLLTVVIGYGEFLKASSGLGASDRDSLDLMLGAALRGSSLVKRLMMFSRAQPLQVAAVNPNQLIRELAPLLERTLGETIEIVTDLDPAVSSIASDRGQLENVVMNLAINSRDAMRAGGRLTLRTQALRGPAQVHEGKTVDGVEITVQDTGEGMSQDILRRAFDPFFTTKSVGKGTGLGLSMVYNFAQAAEGEVRIESQPGVGTVVHLWLPASSSNQAATGAAGDVPESETVEIGKRRRVLIVEDDADVAAYADHVVSGLGFRTVIARSSTEAQALLINQGPWDLLFTDVVLPGGMSGPQLARWAKERLPELPVLFTSGYVRPEDEEQDLQPLLRKPYRKAELVRELSSALDSATARRTGGLNLGVNAVSRSRDG